MPTKPPGDWQNHFAWYERPESNEYWMRSVQFAGLHRILHAVAYFSDGIRVKQLNELIVDNQYYRTERGTGIPAKSTLYHARNTLIRIGAMRRIGNRLAIADDDPLVAVLLSIEPSDGQEMPQPAKECFSALVLRQIDCYSKFFSLFLGSKVSSPCSFRRDASSVFWVATNEGILLHSSVESKYRLLTSAVEVRSILYGVRDWAEKQLRLTDEFYDTYRGYVIYPLKHPNVQDIRWALSEELKLYRAAASEPEWTTVEIRDLLIRICEVRGMPVKALFDALRGFIYNNSKCVKLVTSIEEFSTLGASSRRQADYQLESVFRDSHGRIVSHVRFHKSLQDI